MDSINKEPPRNSTSKEPPQHEAAEKWLDLRDRVARIYVSLKMINELFTTPETEILRALPTYDKMREDGIILNIRNPQFSAVPKGHEIEDLTPFLCQTVCDAGHVIRVFLTGLAAFPENEINLMDQRKAHEKCVYNENR